MESSKSPTKKKRKVQNNENVDQGPSTRDNQLSLPTRRVNKPRTKGTSSLFGASGNTSFTPIGNQIATSLPTTSPIIGTNTPNEAFSIENIDRFSSPSSVRTPLSNLTNVVNKSVRPFASQVSLSIPMSSSLMNTNTLKEAFSIENINKFCSPSTVRTPLSNITNANTTILSNSGLINIGCQSFDPSHTEQNTLSIIRTPSVRKSQIDITKGPTQSNVSTGENSVASTSINKRVLPASICPVQRKKQNGGIDTTVRRLDSVFKSVISNLVGSSSTTPFTPELAGLRRNDPKLISQIIFKDGNMFSGNPWVTRRKAIKKARLVQPIYPEYYDNGDQSWKCLHCGAMFWKDERLGKKFTDDFDPKYPMYSTCCIHGKIELPDVVEPPFDYKILLYTKNEHSTSFHENSRRYNNAFAFTSMGGNIAPPKTDGTGPPNFRIQGQNYHKIGGLLPSDKPHPKFAQLYIVDTANEVKNRVKASTKEGLSEDGQLDGVIVSRLKGILDRCNRLVKLFRQVGLAVNTNNDVNYTLKLIARRSADGRNTSCSDASEIAALIPGDIDQVEDSRDIIVTKHSGFLQRVKETHVLYLPLMYPLIYTSGEDGYREGVLHKNTPRSRATKEHCVTLHQYVSYYLHERAKDSPHLFCLKRLFQQWLVDTFTTIESYRLDFIYINQAKLRMVSYGALDDAFNKGDMNAAHQGQVIKLPQTYVGGPRFMIQNYHDAMTICRWRGYPNLFITFTCNAKWPEIDRFIRDRGLQSTDRIDIQCRVFHIKLKMLMHDIMVNHIFGVDKGAVYTIEYQGRGLPHAHILIWLEDCNQEVNTEFVDKYISAEIPDKESDPAYYDAVNEYVIHGPCGQANTKMVCTNSQGVCTRHYPKRWSEKTEVDEDGYVVYRRRHDQRSVYRKEINLDNRYVVPHNRYLLMKYRAHINVEYCNRSRSIKYLFKYVHKGNDHVTVAFYKASDSGKPVDEVKLFLDCRYVSASEAAWRILGFETHFRKPAVMRLGFHLEGYQKFILNENSNTAKVLQKRKNEETMLTAWFIANKNIPGAKDYTYPEFPIHFTYHSDTTVWTVRTGEPTLGRLYYVYPGMGDLYYQRVLLNYVRGCESFADIRTFQGTVYATHKEACAARGLLDDDTEWIRAIQEGATFGGGAHSLRILFCDQLIGCCVSQPEYVWETCWKLLAEDMLFKYKERMGRNDLVLTDDQIKNMCLMEIEKLLRKRNKSLLDFANMPYPEDVSISRCTNQLILDERSYDVDELKKEHDVLVKRLNAEQKVAYDIITRDVFSKKNGLYFLYGYGGTGKTFVWNTLSAAIRCKGGIVLNVASSGIASLLMPGGRTAHSRFHIPLDAQENSTCNINVKSDTADLIREASLIIWDEAPMVNRYCFEALDKTLRDIMKLVDPELENLPFGGKVIVFGGDFRQILPVIPKGTREEVVKATINSSRIWKDVTVLRLTQNMRLKNTSSPVDAKAISEFSELLMSIGDGTIGGPNDGDAEIEIPEDLLITESDDHIKSIVDATYPNFKDNIGNIDYLNGRAILAPTLENVEKINDYMLSLHPTEPRTYLSADSISIEDKGNSMAESMQSTEYLNTIKSSGLPNHELTLKVDVPVMLMRNLNPQAGLCNGTRLKITKLGNYVIEAEILGGKHNGDVVLISRMTLSPTDSRLPFKFNRRQFPLIRSYAMTINKSQGQSLTSVGIFLTRPVFTHGQLYVAFSRVTSRKGLIILICDAEGKLQKTTVNVVYKEVFNNL